MTKAKETLQSRKFWTSAATALLGFGLFLSGHIDVDKMLDLVRVAAAVYVGGLSVEDGFKRLIPIAQTIAQQLAGKTE